METFSTSLALCAGNHWWIPRTKASDAEFDVFFNLCLIKWLSSHDAGDLRCHHGQYDITVMNFVPKLAKFLLSILFIVFFILWEWYHIATNVFNTYVVKNIEKEIQMITRMEKILLMLQKVVHFNDKVRFN